MINNREQTENFLLFLLCFFFIAMQQEVEGRYLRRDPTSEQDEETALSPRNLQTHLSATQVEKIAGSIAGSVFAAIVALYGFCRYYQRRYIDAKENPFSYQLVQALGLEKQPYVGLYDRNAPRNVDDPSRKPTYLQFVNSYLKTLDFCPHDRNKKDLLSIHVRYPHNSGCGSHFGYPSTCDDTITTDESNQLAELLSKSIQQTQTTDNRPPRQDCSDTSAQACPPESKLSTPLLGEDEQQQNPEGQPPQTTDNRPSHQDYSDTSEQASLSESKLSTPLLNEDEQQQIDENEQQQYPEGQPQYFILQKHCCFGKRLEDDKLKDHYYQPLRRAVYRDWLQRINQDESQSLKNKIKVAPPPVQIKLDSLHNANQITLNVNWDSPDQQYAWQDLFGDETIYINLENECPFEFINTQFNDARRSHAGRPHASLHEIMQGEVCLRLTSNYLWRHANTQGKQTGTLEYKVRLNCADIPEEQQPLPPENPRSEDITIDWDRNDIQQAVYRECFRQFYRDPSTKSQVSLTTPHLRIQWPTMTTSRQSLTIEALASWANQHFWEDLVDEASIQIILKPESPVQFYFPNGTPNRADRHTINLEQLRDPSCQINLQVKSDILYEGGWYNHETNPPIQWYVNVIASNKIHTDISKEVAYKGQLYANDTIRLDWTSVSLQQAVYREWFRQIYHNPSIKNQAPLTTPNLHIQWPHITDADCTPIASDSLSWPKSDRSFWEGLTSTQHLGIILENDTPAQFMVYATRKKTYESCRTISVAQLEDPHSLVGIRVNPDLLYKRLTPEETPLDPRVISWHLTIEATSATHSEIETPIDYSSPLYSDNCYLDWDALPPLYKLPALRYSHYHAQLRRLLPVNEPQAGSQDLQTPTLPLSRFYQSLRLARAQSNSEDTNALSDSDRAITANQLFEGLEQNREKRVVLEGEPGIGKSTLLHYLMHSWALPIKEGNAVTQHLKDYQWAVYLPLHALNTVELSGNELSFEHQEARLWYQSVTTIEAPDQCVPERLFSSPKQVERLLKYLQAHDVAILYCLDGYDELAQESSNDEASRQILNRRLALLHHLLKQRYVILGSRPSQDLKQTTDSYQYNKRINVEGFSTPQVRQFVRDYARHFYHPQTTAYQEFCSAIHRTLRHNDRLRHLSGNPTLLEAICWLHLQKGHDFLASEQIVQITPLYQETVRMLMHKWLQSEGLENSFEQHEALLNFFAKLSDHLWHKNGHLRAQEFSHKLLVSVFKEYQAEHPVSLQLPKQLEDANIAKKLGSQLGLLRTTQHARDIQYQQYAFIHSSLMEYFIAHLWAKQFINKCSEAYTDEASECTKYVRDHIIDRFNDRIWEYFIYELSSTEGLEGDLESQNRRHRLTQYILTAILQHLIHIQTDETMQQRLFDRFIDLLVEVREATLNEWRVAELLEAGLKQPTDITEHNPSSSTTMGFLLHHARRLINAVGQTDETSPQIRAEPMAYDQDTAAGLLLYHIGRQGAYRISDWLKQLTSLNQPDPWGRTILMGAAEQGRLPFINAYADHDWFIDCLDQQDNRGCTALWRAAAAGQRSAIAALADHGAALNHLNDDNVSALEVASRNGHTQCLRTLISKQAQISDHLWLDSLKQAAYQGRLHCLSILLLAKPADSVDKAREEIKNLATTIECSDLLALEGQACQSQAAANIEAREAIRKAIGRGDTEAIDQLAKSGKAIIPPSEEGTDLLLEAVCSCASECLEVLIEYGAQLPQDPYKRLNLLVQAIRYHVPDCFHTLVDLGIKPSQFDSEVLAWIAQRCYERDCRLALVERGFKTEYTSQDETTLLFDAARLGQTTCLQMLIANGASLYPAYNEAGDGLIHTAARYGQREVLDLLMSYVDDNPNSYLWVETSNENGVTPLWIAADFGHTECIRLLADAYRADVDKYDNEGATPVWIAAQNGHKECIRVLAEYGANVHQADKYGNTPVYVAAINSHEECIHLLLDYGAQMPQDDYQRLHLLEHAIQSHNSSYFQTLVDLGIKPDPIESEVLAWVAQYCNEPDCQRAFVQSGLEAANTVQYDTSLLLKAARKGYTNCIRLLIKYNINVNQTNVLEEYPVLIASEKGHVECIRLLAEHGANVDQADKYGNTPVYFAAINDHEKCFHLLLNYGAQMPQDDYQRLHLLEHAIHSHNSSYFQTLVDLGIKPDPIESEVLAWVAQRCNEWDCHQLLIECHLKAEYSTQDETTLLFDAARLGQTTCLQMLIANGASLHPQYSQGDGLIHTAARYGQLEALQLLINYAPDTITRQQWLEDYNKWGSNALAITAQEGHVECMRLLVENGSKVNQAINEYFLGSSFIRRPTNSGYHIVSLNGKPELIACTYTPRAWPESTTTPIFIAAKNGHIECVRLLAKYGADVNKPAQNIKPVNPGKDFFETLDKDAYLPLHDYRLHLDYKGIVPPIWVAAKNGHYECIRLLAEHGANVDQTDKYGNTPVYVAAKNGHMDCLAMLIVEGAQVTRSELEQARENMPATTSTEFKDFVQSLLNTDQSHENVNLAQRFLQQRGLAETQANTDESTYGLNAGIFGWSSELTEPEQTTHPQTNSAAAASATTNSHAAEANTHLAYSYS